MVITPRHFLVVTAVSTAIAVIVAHQGVYRFLIVPRLETVSAVPFVWWLGVMAPVVATALWLGWRSVSTRQVIHAAGVATATQVAYLLLAGMLNQPGMVKSPGPLFVVVIPFLLVSYFVMMGVARFARPIRFR